MKPSQNLVEIAKKKRHVFLLEKLQRGKTLSPNEIKELQGFEGTKADLSAGVVHSQTQVAKAFKVSPRTLRYWINEGMPLTPEGHFDLIEIQAWRILKNKLRRDEKPTDKDKWDTEFRKMKALIARMEYQERKGSLIRIDEVERGRVERILVVKTALLALPQRIAPLLANKSTEVVCDLLTEKIEEIIAEFARDRDDSSTEHDGTERETNKPQPIGETS